MSLPFSSLLQQARDYRSQYDADEEAGLDPNLGAGALNQMRLRHGQERSQAAFNPQWDAWYQAVSNATDGDPVLGGKNNWARQQRARDLEAQAKAVSPSLAGLTNYGVRL